MSTDLKPVDAENSVDHRVSLTQFVGPLPEDGGTRLRLQLGQGLSFFSVSKAQAAELAYALTQWTRDERPEE